MNTRQSVRSPSVHKRAPTAQQNVAFWRRRGVTLLKGAHERLTKRFTVPIRVFGVVYRSSSDVPPTSRFYGAASTL